MTLKIGADPELFLKKKGVFYSGFGVIPGSKSLPYPVNRGAVQVDGMAVEFNILPAENRESFSENIQEVLKILRNMVPVDFDLAIESVAYFEKEYFKSQPRECKLLGCNPDYNAYTEEMNIPPNPRKPIRTAAGHIHLGWGEGIEPNRGHFNRCFTLTKQLDFLLGIPSVVLDRGEERRKMYGQAGCFRPKQYGMEYRVLSNFWLKDTKLIEWVFDQAKRAFELLTEEGVNLHKELGDVARDIINKNNKEGAANLLQKELKGYVNIEALT